MNDQNQSFEVNLLYKTPISNDYSKESPRPIEKKPVNNVLSKQKLVSSSRGAQKVSEAEHKRMSSTSKFGNNEYKESPYHVKPTKAQSRSSHRQEGLSAAAISINSKTKQIVSINESSLQSSSKFDSIEVRNQIEEERVKHEAKIHQMIREDLMKKILAKNIKL